MMMMRRFVGHSMQGSLAALAVSLSSLACGGSSATAEIGGSSGVGNAGSGGVSTAGSVAVGNADGGGVGNAAGGGGVSSSAGDGVAGCAYGLGGAGGAGGVSDGSHACLTAIQCGSETCVIGQSYCYVSYVTGGPVNGGDGGGANWRTSQSCVTLPSKCSNSPNCDCVCPSSGANQCTDISVGPRSSCTCSGTYGPTVTCEIQGA